MPNLDKTLAQMAERLGTKAETLWPQLVATQRMEWWMLAISALALLAVWLLIYRFAEKWDEVGRVIALTFVGIGFGSLLIVALIQAPTMLVYPEVGAAQSLTATGR